MSPGLRRVLALVWLLVAATLVAACGGGVETEDDRPALPEVDSPDGVVPLSELPRAEGRLRLVARPGVVQDGTGESRVDWVSGFEAETGCRVSVTTAQDSREVAGMLASGRFDGAALTGDVTVPLITSGAIAPVNTSLIEGYDDIFEDLRKEALEVAGGRVFAVPVDRVVNELVYRRDRLPGTIRSASALFDPAQAASYGGRLTMPDDPMLIADAALYAQRQQDQLGIENAFELDRDQFAAATSVLYTQRRYVGSYWTQPSEFEDALRSGRAVIGMGPNGVAARLQAEDPPVPVLAVEPSEGATGYIDGWAIATKARHPGCMYRWMQHLLTPQVNALVAEQAGAAPANKQVCELDDAQAKRCDSLNADDAGYWSDVALWRTPTGACGDDRGPVCRTYGAWAEAFDELIRRAAQDP